MMGLNVKRDRVYSIEVLKEVIADLEDIDADGDSDSDSDPDSDKKKKK